METKTREEEIEVAERQIVIHRGVIIMLEEVKRVNSLKATGQIRSAKIILKCWLDKLEALEKEAGE